MKFIQIEFWHVACSHVHKLVCVNDKLSVPLGEDAVYNFVNSMLKESKNSCDVIRKYFNKGLVTIKKDKENFENSTKCRICYFLSYSTIYRIIIDLLLCKN